MTAASRERASVVRPVALNAKPPTHDLDAEASVLSALMLDPSMLEDVARVLAPVEFYSTSNRRIASTIWELSREGAAVDVTTVAAALRGSGHLETVGGTPYLAQIIDATPAVANVVEHARVVHQRARQRRFASWCKAAALEAEHEDDLDGLLDRARKALDDASTERTDKLARLSVDEIFAPLPPVNWLVEGLDLCPGAVNLVAGYGFTGKTAACQSMAVAVATGERVWGTFHARRGRVLHLDYEQGPHLTLRRYQRLCAAALQTPADIGDRLSVVAFPKIYLDSHGAEELLTRELEGHALLIVDSLRAACPTIDENDSGVRIVLDMLSRVSEKTQAVVVVVHHARKPQKDIGGGAQMGIRGSGAIFDACASVLVFEAEKGEPTSVSHAKARTSGKTADPFVLRIDDVEIDSHLRAGLSVTAEGEATGDSRGAAKIAAVEPVVLEVIRKHPGCSLRRLREECSGVRSTLVDAAVEALTERGLVEVRRGPRGAALHHLVEPL